MADLGFGAGRGPAEAGQRRQETEAAAEARIAPWRSDLDDRILPAVDRAADFAVRRWLLLANAAMAVLTALPFLAPVLLALGWTAPASSIYWAYQVTCHQMPSRSYFILGYQMAFCQRNTAIFIAVLLAGLTYALVRERVRPLPFGLYLLLILPMAVDGFTQIFGLRESTWQLRAITGTLFGVSSVWLVYPLMDQVYGRQSAVESRQSRGERRQPKALASTAGGRLPSPPDCRLPTADCRPTPDR